MTTSRISLLPALLALPLPASSQVAPPDSAFRSAEPSEFHQVALDSATMEMERGRHWHAASLLWSAFPQGPAGREDLTLLFASAEAGWNNWLEVGSLLEEALSTGEIRDPRAWYLLGRALDSESAWQAAADAYGNALETAGGPEDGRTAEIRVRRTRALALGGRYPEALGVLRKLVAADPGVGGWAALELAGHAAEEGNGEETRMALGLVPSEEVRDLGWSLPPLALLARGDSVGAEAAFWASLPGLSSSGAKATAWDRVGVLRLARGDSVGARGAFHQVLGLVSSGTAATRAATSLLDLGFDSAAVALSAARVLSVAGRSGEAVDAYGVHEGLRGRAPSARDRLAKARNQLTLGNVGAALEATAELTRDEDPSVGAPSLVLRAQALRRLGRGGEARRLEDQLVERFPERPEAVEVLYLRADALRGRGDLEGAILGYGEAAALAPAENRAGESRMLMGQLFQKLGRTEEALQVYTDYMSDFPQGRRWDEAAFWAGRLQLESGLPDEAEDLLGRLREQHPLSYYALQAGVLLGEPFDPGVPSLPDTLPFPPFLQEGLGLVDRLGAAALDRGAEWEIERLARTIRGMEGTRQRQAVLLRLARELNDRGYTREGINLGWELLREGRPWDRDLLSAVYPFSYQDLVVTAARERQVDPYLVAGLIRQESAFWAEARSRADARGLMQVLPSTGRELARAVGPRSFRPDDHLYEPEVNIHLGTKFFFDMRERFGGDVTLVLSAYNAGPTRARRWREYPEAGDLTRFVERIPFTETRGYVKNVLRNQAVYAWLYGGEEGAGQASAGG